MVLRSTTTPAQACAPSSVPPDIPAEADAEARRARAATTIEAQFRGHRDRKQLAAEIAEARKRASTATLQTTSPTANSAAAPPAVALLGAYEDDFAINAPAAVPSPASPARTTPDGTGVGAGVIEARAAVKIQAQYRAYAAHSHNKVIIDEARMRATVKRTGTRDMASAVALSEAHASPFSVPVADDPPSGTASAVAATGEKNPSSELIPACISSESTVQVQAATKIEAQFRAHRARRLHGAEVAEARERAKDRAKNGTASVP